jgi:ABC-type transport system involved in multi-copper enzyme maturation permease subunit
MSRILALAGITFREGIRNRSVFGILLFSFFILGLNIAVAGFFMRDIGKVSTDMNLSALSFAGLLLVFFVGINLIAKDIDKKTIQLVLSKPISRMEYVWGKFFGIQLFIAVSLVILVVFSSGTMFLLQHIYHDYFGQFSWPVFYLACFFILVKLSVLSSIVVFFSSLTTSSFITLMFSICVYLMGVSVEDVVFYLRSHLAAEGLAISESFQGVVEFISYVVPNFSAFDFKVEAAHGLGVGWERIGLSLGYGVSYLVLMLVFASLLFRRREFN